METKGGAGGRGFGLVGVAAVLALAGAACAQSAAGQGGYDAPMPRKAKAVRVEQPESKSESRSESKSKAESKTRRQVNITRSDEDGTYTITVDGDEIEASVNGKELPDDRIQRDGDSVKLLDDDGNVVAEFHVSGDNAWTGQAGNAWASQGGAWAAPAQGSAFSGAFFGGDNPPPVMLGITMGEPSESLVEHLGLDPGSAVLIGKVYEGLPAAESGMEDEDILVEFDGAKPLTEEKVREILRTKQPGDEVKAKIIRKGTTKDLKIKLRKYDAEKLGATTVEGQDQFFTPQDMQGLSGWGVGGGDEARQALEEALRSLEQNQGRDAQEAREQAHKAIEEALKALEEGRSAYRLQLSPRAFAGPGGGSVILGPRPGQVYNVPPTPAAPSAPGRADLSRQMDELRAQLQEVQRSRDELRQQLDEIKSMLKDMRDRR
jgi:hypothetical protein